MGAKSTGHLYDVPSHKLLKSLTTLMYSVGEDIESIFTDQDSENDNSDCGSDVEYCSF